MSKKKRGPGDPWPVAATGQRVPTASEIAMGEVPPGKVKVEATPRPWARFPDWWAQLNASDQDRAKAARADKGKNYSEEDIAAYNAAWGDFRFLIGYTGAGWPPEQKDEADMVRGRLRKSLMDEGILMVTAPDVILGPPGNYGVGTEPTRGGLSRVRRQTLFDCNRGHLREAWRALADGSPETVFRCRCGKLGPRTRRDRRFCGSACRVKASREKKRSEVVPASCN